MKILELYENTSSEPVTMSEIQGLSETLRNNCMEIYNSFYREPDIKKLRHNTSSERKSLYYDVPNKTNRRPTDTPPYFHNMVDDMLYEKYSIRFRSNSIFTYYRNPSSSYYTLFPYDNYKMVTSPDIDDMYIVLEGLVHRDKRVVGALREFLEKHGSHEIFSKSAPTSMLMYIFDIFSSTSWTKGVDFPNVKEFIEQVKGAAERWLGSDYELNATESDYNDLLNSILDIVTRSIGDYMDTYREVNTPNDINTAGKKNNEIMVYSERFVLVDMNVLYRLVNRHDGIYTEDDVMEMLFENDLTVFEKSLNI